MRSHQITSKSVYFVGILAALAFAGCKSKSSGGSVAPSPTPSPTLAPVPNNITGTTPPASTASIEVVGRTGTTFDFSLNDIVQLSFKLNNPTGTATTIYQSALAEMPTGGQLTNRDTASPTFTWTATTAGTYYVTLLIRDMGLCQKSGAADCVIAESQYGTVTPNSAYDISQRFTLTVQDRVGTNNNSGLGNVLNNNNGTNGTTPATGTLGSIFSSVGNALGGVGNYVWNIGSGVFNWIKGLIQP